MASDSFQVLPAQAEDLPALEAVHRTAFAGEMEARLVRLLFSRGKASISLKAVVSEQIVGHVLFSPARETNGDVGQGRLDSPGLGLAPLAVVPQYQRRGIGAALVGAGLEACRQQGVRWIVVLGDPAYYGRFGFLPASRFGLLGEFGGEDAFQILALGMQPLPASGQTIYYSPEFREIFPE